MNGYGITSTGFEVPRLTDIRESIIENLQSSLAVEVKAKPNSVLGQLVDVMSEHYLALWEEMYNGFRQLHPQCAESNHLDIAAGYTSVIRKTAGKTTGYVRVYGSTGAVVPAKTEIRDGNTGAIYLTEAEKNLSLSSVSTVKIEAAMSVGTEYSITVGGNEITYNSGNSASATALMKSMVSEMKSLGYDAVSTGSILTISSPPPQYFSFSCNEAFEVTEISAGAAITCAESGEYKLSSGTSMSLVSGIAGVDKLTVPFNGVTGSSIEQDADFRARYYTSLFSPGDHTTASIRAAIENDVLGVESCRVFENTGSSVDSMGRPPNSIHAVVKGGASGEIGSAILARIPAGISSHGRESVGSVDAYGESHEIKFDRPEEVFVWLRIEVQKLPASEERYPSNSAEIIKAAVAAGAQSDHGIGSDVVAGRLASYAYKQSGVAYVKMGIFSTTSPTNQPQESDFSYDNVEIRDNQIAVFDAARMEVI